MRPKSSRLRLISIGLLATGVAGFALVKADEGGWLWQAASVAAQQAAPSTPAPAAGATFATSSANPDADNGGDGDNAGTAPATTPVANPTQNSDATAAVPPQAGAAFARPAAVTPPAPVSSATTPQAPAPTPTAPRPTPAAAAPLVIKRILPINGPIRYGQWYWDEANVPPGPLMITVDLKARVLSAFRGGYEIGATAVLVGAPQKPTPVGVFPILEKQVRHFSSLYSAAPMPYMQRLTRDGVTLHASHVRNGYASHGCIGMPLDFARKLYGATHIGDRVIITNGKQAELGDPLVGG